MGAMKAEIDEIKKIVGELEAEGHKLAAPLKARLDKLFGEMPVVEAEVKADAEKVEHDAVAAEKPVVNEAVQDVAAVGETAVTGSATDPVKP